MKFIQTFVSTAAIAAVLAVTASAVQDKKPVDPNAGTPKPASAPATTPAAGQKHEMPEVKPGPEHARLAKTAGTWDATVTCNMDGTPQITKGTETRKMVGEVWLVSDFNGEMQGKPFVGHMIEGYDPLKKKYVGVWISSMQTSPSMSEGVWDDATKTMTCKVKCTGPDGKEMLSTHVTEFKDNDTMTSKMSGPGPDGKEANMMTIEYKRKKTSG